MFRFFRRKKSKEENKVNQEPETTLVPEQAEESEAEVAVVEREEAILTPSVPVAPIDAAVVPTSTSTPSPVTESESAEPTTTDSEAVESEPMVEARVEEVGVVSETDPVATSEAAEKAKLVVPATEGVQEQPIQEAEPAAKASWMQRLRQGLSRTGSNIGALFVGVKVDEELFEELETALLMADAGIEATESLLTKLRAKVKQQRIEEGEQVKEALKELLTEHLKPLEKSFMLPLDGTSVVMIAGVNGAGKTTSIGKLAHHFQASGASVLLAAGDTFRAAAREQLVEWGKRNNVAVISQDGGDPAAVAFDAVNAGKARQANVVMIDTAGRLPTQLHLMEELKKIKRVINKADNEAPHEVLLVVDGNTGQNVITQIKTFDAALGLTGLVVTKLDGTAKGGTLAAVSAGSQGVRPIPVYWIGVGESLHDLQPFSAAEFASALLG
ncbi:MAG: signal recognition particle-docking protein FtsY [Oligella ureolytica]|nr:signal recognition particle-docking protein FtsY [Oligella ureolytica]